MLLLSFTSLCFGDHYSALGLQRTASQEGIRRAWIKAIKQNHPDLPQNRDNPELIKAINVAYEVLSDPESRKNYDLELGAPKSNVAKPKPDFTAGPPKNGKSPIRNNRRGYDPSPRVTPPGDRSTVSEYHPRHKNTGMYKPIPTGEWAFGAPRFFADYPAWQFEDKMEAARALGSLVSFNNIQSGVEDFGLGAIIHLERLLPEREKIHDRTYWKFWSAATGFASSYAPTQVKMTKEQFDLLTEILKTDTRHKWWTRDQSYRFEQILKFVMPIDPIEELAFLTSFKQRWDEVRGLAAAADHPNLPSELSEERRKQLLWDLISLEVSYFPKGSYERLSSESMVLFSDLATIFRPFMRNVTYEDLLEIATLSSDPMKIAQLRRDLVQRKIHFGNLDEVLQDIRSFLSPPKIQPAPVRAAVKGTKKPLLQAIKGRIPSPLTNLVARLCLPNKN